MWQRCTRHREHAMKQPRAMLSSAWREHPLRAVHHQTDNEAPVPTAPTDPLQGTKIFLNGKWIGIHRQPDELKGALLKLRRCLSITEDVSVAYDHALGEVRIYNDWGRVCRPLYVVENSSIKITKLDIRRLQVRRHARHPPVCPRLPWQRAAAVQSICIYTSVLCPRRGCTRLCRFT